jgi:hypothetical protein
MFRKITLFLIIIHLAGLQILAQNSNAEAFKEVSVLLKKDILNRANEAIKLKPITVTAKSCERSVGGKHDFYSEGDYWWQNPDDPTVLIFSEMDNQIQIISRLTEKRWFVLVKPLVHWHRLIF